MVYYSGAFMENAQHGTLGHATLKVEQFLQEELLKRCERNPRYSLRAFAKSLQLHPATLSHILGGRRPITRKLLKKLGTALELSPDTLQEFEAHLSFRRSKRAAQADARSREDFYPLANDVFRVVSDWYHFALLELIKVKGFQPKPAWIARTLGVTVNEVNIAVERLQRIGLLEIRDGQWKAVFRRTSSEAIGTATTGARRKFQRQILQKAIDALEQTPLGEREQSAMTFSMDSRLMPIAIEEIESFRKNLTAKLGAKVNHDRVYHLSVSLYPVSQKIVRNKEK